MGCLSRTGYGLMVGVLACAVTSCGEPEEQQGAETRPSDESGAAGITEGLSSCSSARRLVCGKDGKTYLNSCRAGGSSKVAHYGACAHFVCNGVKCVSGFTCRSFTSYGVPIDQCVSNTGNAPSCTCPSGSRCVEDPSGATRCEADPPPPPPPDPSTLCHGKSCPSGQHCAVITVYGVPTPSCMYN